MDAIGKRGLKMGGRGSAGGKLSNYVSGDKTLLKGDTVRVERLTGGWYGSDAIVLQAATDGKGNLTLSYADADDYRQQNKRTTYAVYDLQHGITNRSDSGKSTDLKSVNIDWGNVKSVRGKTYGTQSLMREKGFKWDPQNKIWKK